MATMAACPKQWHFKYVAREADAPSISTVAGSALHDGAAMWEAHRINGRDVSRDDLERMVLNFWHATLRKADMKVWGNASQAHMESKGLAVLVNGYMDLVNSDEATGRRVVAVEEQLTYDVGRVEDGDETFELVGHIDQVVEDPNEGTILRELKTGTFRPQHHMQMETYLGLWQLTTGEAVIGHLVSLKGGKAKIERVVPTIGGVGLAQQARDTHRLSQAYRRNAPPLGVFNGSCDLCAYRSMCPAGKVGQVNL